MADGAPAVVPEALPQNVGEAIDELNRRLAVLRVDVNNEFNNVAQNVGVHAAAAAAANPAAHIAAHIAPRFRINFTDYNAESQTPEQDFESWEQQTRFVCGAQGYAYTEQLVRAILAQFKGRAALMVRNLGENIAGIPDLDALMDRLRLVFVSPSYQAKALSTYYRRTQQPNESIIQYHSSLRALWERAFSVTDRQESSLIRHFISGLKNREIRKELTVHDDNDVRDYQSVCEKAMKMEGALDVVAIDDERIARGGEYTAHRQLMMIPTTPRTGGGGNGGVVPMEIGNISTQNTRRGRGRGRGNSRGQPRGQSSGRGHSQWRGHSQPRGFNAWRGQNRGRGGPGQSNNHFRGRRFNSQHNPPRPMERMDVNNTNSGTTTTGCFNCGGQGHWIRDCTRPRQNQQRGGQRGYRGQRGGQRVHYIEEAAASKN